MIIETAAAFVSTISALSTIVKAITATKKFSDDTLEMADRIASTREPENNSVRALVATKIDGDFIEIATENIKRVLERLKKDWRDPSVTQAGKDDALDTAGYVICSELRRIKKLNGDQLPGEDRFHELWESHGCATP